MASYISPNGGSSTAVMEVQPIPLTPLQKDTAGPSSTEPCRQISKDGTPERPDDASPLPPPTTATEIKQRWNAPRSNIPRVAACFWSFVVMGSNDAAYGPLIPYIQAHYGLTYLVVSLIFLAPFVGYTAAAFLNNFFHLRVGQRGVACVCSACHLASYVVIALHPPYPVLVVAFMLAGFGNGVADAAWNAWIGNMARANELLGFLHGLYGAGAVLSPLIATTMITKGGLEWFSFYYIMVCSCSSQ